MKMIIGLGIPSNLENSRLRLEVESFPGLAVKLTRVQGKQFLWTQAACMSIRPSLAGCDYPSPRYEWPPRSRESR